MTSASLFSQDITPVALVSCARTGSPGSHTWQGDLADGSSKGVRCSLHLPGSEEQIQMGLLPLGPLEHMYFQWLGGWEVPELQGPPPPSWSSPHHTDLTCGMTALPALISEPGPAGSMWGLVCCCQKGFVGWALIVNRNSLKCT